ncbi:MAG: hypothetical protein LBH70_03010, partial [Spirochaetaceae bacterium]|nr:hypothetical protein [Spirochaetaceae bacterium]
MNQSEKILISFFNRLRALAGSLIKPVRAGWMRLPRLWAFITRRKAGGVSLYRQKFSSLDLGDLLLAVGRELPGDKKDGAGQQRKTAEIRSYCLPPGTVRI